MKAYLDYIDNESENNLSKTNLKNYLRVDNGIPVIPYCNNIPIIPYCREERQFAALLYSIFLAEKKKKHINDAIVKKCLGVENKCEHFVITDVYFEATLMRDYFAICKTPDEKIYFNEELLKYCLVKEDSDKVISELKKENCLTRNLGQKEAKSNIKKVINKLCPDLENKLKVAIVKSKTVDDSLLFKHIREKSCLDIASMMMNATPDILVIYKDEKENIYAKALECKYTSDEGRYHDVAGAEYPMQLFIQECIMGFCFGVKEKRNASDGHQEIDAHIPQFPENSKIWKDKKELWEDICQKVYKDILNNNDRMCKQVINTGVELIRFETEINRTENDKKKKLYEDEEKCSKNKKVAKEIFIRVEDLMQVYSDAAK